MSQSTICPYCNTRLRLSSSAKRPSRVKCRKCDRGFHPSQVVEDHGASQYLNQPLQAPRPSEPKDVQAEPPAIAPDRNAPDGELSPAATSVADPAPLHPAVADAAFPSEMLERRAKREEAGVRVRERKGRAQHRMKTHEIAMLVGLLVIGLGGAASLGWYVFKPAPSATNASESTAKPEPDEPKRAASVLEGDFAEKPLPRQLIGMWDLRNDDDRRGWFEFRSDGEMIAYAWIGDDAETPSREKWFLNQENGENLVIEVGPEIGVIGNFKYSLTMTGNDAFTLTQIAQKEVRHRESQRFVRRTPTKSPAP